MAEFVEMFHPDLPKQQTIRVPARSVEHRRACGWVEAPVDAPVEKEPEKATAKPKSEGNA